MHKYYINVLIPYVQIASCARMLVSTRVGNCVRKKKKVILQMFAPPPLGTGNRRHTGYGWLYTYTDIGHMYKVSAGCRGLLLYRYSFRSRDIILPRTYNCTFEANHIKSSYLISDSGAVVLKKLYSIQIIMVIKKIYTSISEIKK